MENQTSTKINPKKPLGLIAGNGQFPLDVAKRAREKGVEIIAIAHNDETDRELAEHVKQCSWIYPGQLGKAIKILKKNHVDQVVFAGGLRRPKLFKGLKPDLKAVMLMARLKSFKDDVVLRAIAGELEKNGIAVFSAADILEESLARAGVLSSRKLSAEEQVDAQIGWECARVSGSLDIGQTVVVNQKTIVAVEAVEGTDNAILRGGELSGDGSTVVKLCKTQQDLRLDLPAVGTKTIESMIKAGARALVIEAGKTILLNPIEVIKMADEARIAIVAVNDVNELH